MMHRTATSTPASNAGWHLLDSSNPGEANRFLLKDKLPYQPIIQDVPLQTTVNTTPSHYFAPPPKRTALKKKRERQLTSPSPCEPQRRVGFWNSVDVRVSLVQDPGIHCNRWYTTNEILYMRAMAMERNSPLRHSLQAVGSTSASQLQQQLQSSPPPQGDNAASSNNGRPHYSRAHSATAQLNTLPSSDTNTPDALDIRYQQLISEMDREIFIRNEDRRYSTCRRLHHYCKVFDEIDRQVDENYRMIHVGELSNASLKASGDELARALERARKEATIAQAIMLMGSMRRSLL